MSGRDWIPAHEAATNIAKRDGLQLGTVMLDLLAGIAAGRIAAQKLGEKFTVSIATLKWAEDSLGLGAPATLEKVTVRRSDVLGGEAVTSGATASVAGAKPGRKAEIDWLAIYREVIRIAELNGLPQDPTGKINQADLCRTIGEWCDQQGMKVPGDSILRDHVRQIARHIAGG